MNCFASWMYLFLRQSLRLLVDEKDVMSKGGKKDSEMQIEKNARDTTKSRPLRNPVISKTRSINITCYDQPEQEDRIEPRVAVRLKLRQARWNPLHTFLVQLNSSIWEVLTWPRTGIVAIYHVSVDDRNREFKCKTLQNVCWKLGKNLAEFESCMCAAVRPTENAQEIQSCAPKKLVIWLQQTTHFSTNMVSLATATSTRWSCRIWQLNGYRLVHAKRRVHKEQKRVWNSLSNPNKVQRWSTRITRWNLAKCVPISSAFTDPRQTTSQKEQCGDWKTTFSDTSAGLDQQWWTDAMECCCYLRNVQELWSDGKTPYEKAFWWTDGSNLPFGLIVECHPISAKDQAKLLQFGKKVLRGIVGCALCAWEEFGKETLKSWKTGRVRYSCSKTKRDGGSHTKERMFFFIFPCAHGTGNLTGKVQEVQAFIPIP